MGRVNGRAIARNPRSAVTALCDLFEDRMQEFAKELPEPVTLYTDYKKLCAAPDIDAIFVGTPNQMHVPVALEAIRNGKHVLVTFFRTVNGLPETSHAAIPRRGESLDLLTEHFVACVLDGAPCQAPVRDGLVVQEMLEALLTSAETGREVRWDA